MSIGDVTGNVGFNELRGRRIEFLSPFFSTEVKESESQLVMIMRSDRDILVNYWVSRYCGKVREA
jgi:hypothetical protein